MIKQLILLFYLTALVRGHGRLVQPPSRSSMWRYGYNTPINYNDNALYCGGFSTQWNKNGGRCGICGDPYDGERANEAGGKYATGTISATYNEGDVIEVKVQITANHLGFFEFRICANNDVTKPATLDCLNQNLLQLNDGSGTRYYVPPEAKIYTIYLKLPSGLVCSQCVFQWRYHTGNSWGVGSDGIGCNGCGPQEEFYNCADVAISGSSGLPNATISSATKSTNAINTASTAMMPKTTVSSSSPIPTKTTTMTGTVMPSTCKGAGDYAGVPGQDQWCVVNCAANYCPATHCICTTGTAVTTNNALPSNTPAGATSQRETTTTTIPLSTPTRTIPFAITTPRLSNNLDSKVCLAVGVWKGMTSIDNWCQTNCLRGNCPAAYCKCTEQQTCSTYTAYGQYKGDSVVDRYCQDTCKSGNCDSNVCQCSIKYSTNYNCSAKKAYENLNFFTNWCAEQCSTGNCISNTYCTCQTM